MPTWLTPEFFDRVRLVGQMFGLAILVYLVLRLVVLPFITALAERTRTDWDRIFVRRKVFHWLAALVPGVIIQMQVSLVFAEGSRLGELLSRGAGIWILFFALLSLYAALEASNEIYNTTAVSKQLPLRSFIQVVKLIAFLIFLIVFFSLMMGKSPTLLVSGLGALTAVFMLLFKDPILGFAAGIILSANRMLTVGDWLEMPKYGADGDVIDIALTTVKVRNWDQTITTIPSYALISDSFKNWRGMQESGGRRICRNIHVDMTSIRFLTPEDIETLRKAKLLTEYIAQKVAAIESHNRDQGTDPSCPLNCRALTNIGTFRAYLASYINAHPDINHGMTAMVRQLQPTEFGLPLQIYAFTADTRWVTHENVQSDIFDHILAIIGEFGLRVFQSPSGADVRELKNTFQQEARIR